jgi:hypothetical protein
MRSGLSRAMVASSFSLAILIVSVACLRAQDGKPRPDATPSALAKGLMGTWVLAGTPEKEVEPPAKGGRLKFITAKHWTVTESDETGKVDTHHGGTCTFEGDEYTETVNYANENTAELIGQSFKFRNRESLYRGLEAGEVGAGRGLGIAGNWYRFCPRGIRETMSSLFSGANGGAAPVPGGRRWRRSAFLDCPWADRVGVRPAGPV